MLSFINTPMADQASAMCKAVLASPEYSRIGQITGEPGTAKTATTQWLCTQFDAVRIEAWVGMKEKTVLQELATALTAAGHQIDTSGKSNTLIQRLVRGGVQDKLIIVDEANHLKWPALELLRSISDIGGAGLIIAGTDFLAKKFTPPQIHIFLAQFRQRVGT